MKQSYSKLHRHISLYKSTLRILAGVALLFGSFYAAGLWLIIAEALCIIEELLV